MYLLKRAFVALCLSLFCFVAYAQKTVSGTVKDATGEAMIGVTVLADGKAAAVTDIDGNFAVPNATPSTVIKVTYVGYKDQQITVGNSTNLNIVMQEDNKALDEVVVVGYGTMKKSDLTGSISSMNTDDIVSKGASNVLNAMQGAVPGVNITQSSSRPGGSMNIEIRGKSSINSSTTPLFIVDGVMCDNIDFLNEQDIEKIDILKDASSTAIYGSRATAGVVIVTTKGGLGVKKGSKPTISYDGYYGVAVVSRMPEFQDAQQFYDYRFKKFLSYAGGVAAAQSGTPNYQLSQGAYDQGMILRVKGDATSGSVLKDRLAQGLNTDWPSLVTQNGRQQNHYIGISGSTSDISYNLGLGYTELEGTYKGDRDSKITFKGGLDANVNKYLSAGFNVNLAHINHDYASDKAVQEAYRANPFMVPYDEEGNIINNPGNKNALGTNDNQFSDSYNPLLFFTDEQKNRETWRLLGNAYLTVKPFEGLTFKTTFSPNYTYYREGYWSGTETGNDKTKATNGNKRSISWVWDNVLSYEKIFDKIHRLNLMALYSMESSNSENMSLGYSNIYDGTYWWNIGKNGFTASDGTLNITDGTTGYTENSMTSYAFRANYTLLDRYMLTATMRWDGSSKFAKGHKWGSFPSFALAWRMSEEKFIKDNAKWISNLKLRLSYGVTGNNAGISNFEYMLGVSGPNYYPFGGTYANGMYPSGVVDGNIHWEKSHELNVGLDFGFLNSRIFGSIDWYNKKSNDLLYNVTLPYEAGAITMKTNIGSVRNRGIEANVTGVIIQNKDLNWTVTANYAHNSNHVLEIDGTGNNILSGHYNDNLFMGGPVNNVYGYQWTGIVTDGDMVVPNNEIAVAKGFTPGTTVKQTDYYYACYKLTEGSPIVQDVNGDGKFDDADKKVFRADPAWTGSISTTVSYKGWDFSTSIYTKQHFNIYSNFYERFYDLTDRGRMRLNMDSYVPAGTLIDCDGVNADGTYVNPKYQQTTHYGTFPFPNNGGTNGGTNNAYWSGEDGAANFQNISFTKIKNITLGYTFPKAWTQKFGCSKLRLYINVTNPFVITGYKGFDPEWANTSLKQDGPSTTTWQFGANIKF